VLDLPTSIGELNTRAAAWLATVVHARPHRVTGEPPWDRLERERPLRGPLPRVRYASARRQPRRVGRVPLVEVDGARSSVPPELAGQLVEARLPVASSMLAVRSGGQLVASHPLAAAGQTAWDPSAPGGAGTPGARSPPAGPPPSSGDRPAAAVPRRARARPGRRPGRHPRPGGALGPRRR
jgi:hypothetical protein